MALNEIESALSGNRAAFGPAPTELLHIALEIALGDAELRAGCASRAIPHYREALRHAAGQHIDAPGARLKLADALMKAGHIAHALDVTQAAVHLTSDYAPGWFALAKAEIANGAHPAAIAALRRWY